MQEHMRNKTHKQDAPPEYTKRKSSGLSWVLTIVFTTLLLIGIAGGAFWERLKISSQVLQLNNRKQELTQQIEEKKHAIVEMRNRKEALCSWDHIRSKISEYQLGMVKLDSNNVRYLSRCSIEEYNSGVGFSSLMEAGPGSQPTGVAMQLPAPRTP